MKQANYQTVQLSKGKHRSPDDGACVMELASMLAGEQFTDHPRSVCPVVAILLRGYNDGVDDRYRQDLYSYAAASVGTRDDGTRRRLRACERRFGIEVPLFRLPGKRLRAVGHAALRAGVTATPSSHRAMLSFLDELIGVPATSVPDRAQTPVGV